MEEKTQINFENKTFKPKAVAQRCPVCNGFGTVGYGRKICQACEGKGYVLIPAETEERKKDGSHQGR